VLVENGQAVEFGQPLFEIEPAWVGSQPGRAVWQTAQDSACGGETNRRFFRCILGDGPKTL